MIARSTAVTESREIRADPDTLFRAWTDPRQLRHWWRQAGDGWAFVDASIDLRVDGRYRLAMTGPDGRTHAAVGVYREILPPARLAFTWDWEDPAARMGETLVTVAFEAIDDDRTQVIVTHERFAEPARMGRHEQGWRELLELLAQFVA